MGRIRMCAIGSGSCWGCCGDLYKRQQANGFRSICQGFAANSHVSLWFCRTSLLTEHKARMSGRLTETSTSIWRQVVSVKAMVLSVAVCPKLLRQQLFGHIVVTSVQAATGIGVVSTGHCHPKVVKAIQKQAADLIFAQQNVFAGSKPMVRWPH